MSLLGKLLAELLNEDGTVSNDATLPSFSVICNVVNGATVLSDQQALFLPSLDTGVAGSYAVVYYGLTSYSQGLLCRPDVAAANWKWVVPYNYVSRFLVEGGVMTAYLDPTAAATVPADALVFKEGVLQQGVTTIPAGAGTWGVVEYNSIYTLPVATDAKLGGVTVPATSGLTIDSGTGALAVDPTTISSKLPVASTTVSGIIKIAADSDVTTGTSTTLAVTPAQLKTAVTSIDIPLASTTVAGKIELATDADITTGTDTTKAVTPAQLKTSITSVDVPVATTAVAGKVQLATAAEALAHTDSAKAVTSVGLAPYALTSDVATDIATAVAHLPNRIYADTLWTEKTGPSTVPGTVDFFTTTIPANTVKPGGRLVIKYTVDDSAVAANQNADGSNKFSTKDRGVTLSIGTDLIIGGTGANLATDPSPPVSGMYVWGIGTTSANYSAPNSVAATYIKQVTTCTIWVDSTGAGRVYASAEGIGSIGAQGTASSSPATVATTIDFTKDQVIKIQGQYGATTDQIFIGNVEVEVTN